MNFGPATKEEEIAAWIDNRQRCVEDHTALVELLEEQHPLYAGRSSSEIIRLRGYLLAAFERIGLPDTALAFVLDELESGHNAYTVAAAAVAMRGVEAPTAQLVPFLLQAIANMEGSDDAVTFARYKPQWPLVGESTTALVEILRSLTWLGPNARSALRPLEGLRITQGKYLGAQTRIALDTVIAQLRSNEESTQGDTCCTLPLKLGWSATTVRDPNQNFSAIAHIALEDQEGRYEDLATYLQGKPAIVTFFYTRCNNPNKCSLTITKLARLQRALQAAELLGAVKVAAFTYDPLFDSASRLKAFGSQRGIEFGENMRFFRAPTDFEKIQAWFALGVNFIQSLVNWHRIELYIVDAKGRIYKSATRLQWDEHEVVQQVQQLLLTSTKESAQITMPPSHPTLLPKGKALLTNILPTAVSILIAAFPKCALCWAAYAGALGIGWLQRIPYSPWLLTVFIGFMLLHLAALIYRAKITGKIYPLVISLMGSGILLTIKALNLPSVWGFWGIGLIFLGTLANSFATQLGLTGPFNIGINRFRRW